MFVPIPPAPPTPEAKDLSASIVALIRQSRQENPSIGPRDVRQAMQLALASMRGELGGSRFALVAILLLALAALAGFLIVLLKVPK